MGYIVKNSELKKILFDEVKAKSNIDIIFDSKIDFFEDNNSVIDVTTTNKNGVTAKQYKADLLITADGKNSKLRELTGIKVIEKDYHQSAITFNVEHSKPHDRIAIERFMPTGPFAILPMKNTHQSSIVWTVKTSHANHYMQIEEKDFLHHVTSRLNGELGDVKIISQKLSFPLNLKYTKRYFDGRAVLIGDPALGIHPIAGQGFNQAVKDIKKLTAIIAEKSVLGLDLFSEEDLKKYESQAFADNIQMILATDFFNSLFSNDNLLLKIGRRLGMSAVNKSQYIKSFFINKARGAKS